MTDQPVPIVPDLPPIDSQELQTHITRYRTLAEQSREIAAKMDTIKTFLFPHVKASGGYHDNLGYARIVERASAPSYTSSDVDALATTWCKSEDPIMKSCGQMLLAKRKITAGTTYIQIK